MIWRVLPPQRVTSGKGHRDNQQTQRDVTFSPTLAQMIRTSRNEWHRQRVHWQKKCCLETYSKCLIKNVSVVANENIFSNCEDIFDIVDWDESVCKYSGYYHFICPMTCCFWEDVYYQHLPAVPVTVCRPSFFPVLMNDKCTNHITFLVIRFWDYCHLYLTIIQYIYTLVTILGNRFIIYT